MDPRPDSHSHAEPSPAHDEPRRPLWSPTNPEPSLNQNFCCSSADSGKYISTVQNCKSGLGGLPVA